jgi:hypothetical protein
MAIDTIISNNEIVVIGPPKEVLLYTESGQKGDRGAIFFSGFGFPDSELLSSPKIGDLYINREPGIDYGSIYILSAVTGGRAWIKSLKFDPVVYGKSSSVSFVSGNGSVSFPLSDFYPNAPESLSASEILIQATIELENPAMISVSGKQISGTGSERTFITNLNAAQFSSGSVSSLSSSCYVNFLITVGDL